jgi:hypothetical protein
MSSDHFCVGFVRFVGKTKRQMPWKVGHSSDFSIEEDEQQQ